MNLQAVVVLYKQSIGQSKTIPSLCEHAENSGLHLSLLIYDNSPEPQTSEHAIAGNMPATYIHDSANGGLVPAYNRALQMAKENGAEWLLLLDHDTVLTASYFAELTRALKEYGENSRVAAFAPHILVRSKCLAPSWFFMGLHRRVKFTWHGLAQRPITSLNSATVVRVSFLDSMGGFDRRYPLNFTDYWLYREIYRQGKNAVVLNCTLAHELSSANRDTFRPVPLYRDVLYHEGIFYRSSGSRITKFVFWSRLMVRVIKHYLVFEDKGYSGATLSYIRRELFSKNGK